MTGSSESARPRLVARALGVIAGLSLALVLLESACKVADVVSEWRDQRIARRISRVSDIPGVRYELVPNVSSKTPELDVVIHVNNLGFRGPDVAAEKPADTYRIAVLGDSIAFARTLPEEDTFPGRLAKLLQGRIGSRRVEVINASLSGRDTWEEKSLLEHEILRLEPDLVLLQICLNDHVQLPFPERDTTLGVFGEQAWYDYSSLLALLDRRIPGFRRRHVRWMKRLGLDRRSRERVILDHYIDPGQMVSIEKDWPQWSRVLLQIRDLARSRGAAVLFVVFPIDTRIAEHASETAPILTRFAAENDIPLLDLVKVFAESREPVLIDYTHPNAIGHRLAAKAIADAILERFADSRGAAAAHVPARSGLRESRARDISGEFSGGETAFREVR